MHRSNRQAWLYLAPAFLILAAFLVMPTVVTVKNSFYDSRLKNFVGFANYLTAFTSPGTLVAFRNNFLWLIVATTFTVVVGLVLAVLLDRVRYESVAKSVLFLPMAISYVGASIIWKFIYAYRPKGYPQIGLLNALLLWFSEIATHPVWRATLTALWWTAAGLGGLALLLALTRGIYERIQNWVFERRPGWALGLLGAGFLLTGLAWILPRHSLWEGSSLVLGVGGVGMFLVGLLWVLPALGGSLSLIGLAWGIQQLLAPPSGSILELVDFALWGAGVALFLFVIMRDPRWGPLFALALIVGGLARFVLDQAGFSPMGWLIERPWTNNLALIAVFVWIWTGFCTVILSAAYKGISRDLLEAARIDGASEWQVFWYVIVPFMMPTIAVVTTTMIINVLKVFDIVYVMTNGNFDTEVLANYMYKMFFFRNYGMASTVATILLVLIIPAIVFNVRQFRRQEAVR